MIRYPTVIGPKPDWYFLTLDKHGFRFEDAPTRDDYRDAFYGIQSQSEAEALGQAIIFVRARKARMAP